MNNPRLIISLFVPLLLVLFLFPDVHTQNPEKYQRYCNTRNQARENIPEKIKPAGNDTSGEEQFIEFRQASIPECRQSCEEMINISFHWVLGVLAATIIAGFLVRFRTTRNIRGLFLIFSVALLGFYHGGCPCPISSFENTILYLAGVDVLWKNMIWFLGLIPLTYFCGKVYCGWICHLGALQEIIFQPGKFRLLYSRRAQKIMKLTRLVLLIVLLIQLLLTKTLLFEKIDPFKAVFNLFSSGITGWILLVLLILLSVFAYRPFCRSACPIGMILGLTVKMPGASAIKNISCNNSCGNCEEICRIHAISDINSQNKIDQYECNACGDCISSCTEQKFYLKSILKRHYQIDNPELRPTR